MGKDKRKVSTMKKKHLLGVLAVALCLMGCSNEESSEIDAMLEEAESNKNSSILSEVNGENYATALQYCAESKAGFYYYDGSRVYLLNKQNGDGVLLCAKINCEHDYYIDEDRVLNTCDAIFELSNCIQVYNDKLYIDVAADTTVQTLYRMNNDGTAREVVIENIFEHYEERMQQMEESGDIDLDGIGASVSWEIYNDIIYLCSIIESEEEDKSILYVDTYNVHSGEKIEELAKETIKGSNGIIIDINIYSNNLKLSTSISEQISGGMGEYIEYKRFFDVDISTGEVNSLLEDSSVSTYAMIDEGMLYREKGEDFYLVNANGQKELCIELNEIEKECVNTVCYTGEYIFITPNLKNKNLVDEYGYYTKVYDKEYKLLDTIKLPDNMMPIAGHNQILLSLRGQQKLYFFDPAQIGTGNVEVKEYTVK